MAGMLKPWRCCCVFVHKNTKYFAPATSYSGVLCTEVLYEYEVGLATNSPKDMIRGEDSCTDNTRSRSSFGCGFCWQNDLCSASG